MAYSFDGTNDDIQLDAAWDYGSSSGPWSISAWINPTAAASFRTIFAADAAFGIHFRVNNNDTLNLDSRAFQNIGFSTGTVTEGVWQQVGVIYAPGLAFYIAGADAGATLVNTPGMNGTSCHIGSAVGGQWFFGSIAELAGWNVILTAAEMAALGKGYTPLCIRPNSLVDYFPLIRSPNGRKRSFTHTINGATVADHPRIIYPSAPQLQPFVRGVEYFLMQPDADSSDGTWSDQDGGTSLFAAIDETTIDDADYIKSADTPVNDICKIRLSDPTVTPAQPFMVRYRYRKTGPAQIDLIVRLLEGTTEIAAWTHTDVADTFVTVEQTLSGGQFAAIGDFNNLFIELNANAP